MTSDLARAVRRGGPDPGERRRSRRACICGRRAGPGCLTLSRGSQLCERRRAGRLPGHSASRARGSGVAGGRARLGGHGAGLWNSDRALDGAQRWLDSRGDECGRVAEGRGPRRRGRLLSRAVRVRGHAAGRRHHGRADRSRAYRRTRPAGGRQEVALDRPGRRITTCGVRAGRYRVLAHRRPPGSLSWHLRPGAAAEPDRRHSGPARAPGPG